MSKKLCMEHLNGECRNLAKKAHLSGLTNMIGLECPHCLREDGKDGNGNQLVDAEKAKKVFEILKDKVEE